MLINGPDLNLACSKLETYMESRLALRFFNYSVRGGWLWFLLFLLAQGCSTFSALSPVTPPGRDRVPLPALVPTPGSGKGSANGNIGSPSSLRTLTGKASWYGPGFEGKKTASGEIFDDSKFTAASKVFPLGSRAKVINLASGDSVEVLINDRGPFADGRVIDLSRAAAEAIGIIDSGLANVRVELLSKPTEKTANTPAQNNVENSGGR